MPTPAMDCGAELARVVPDEKYPGMWRVRSSDSRLSDMLNLTRAKDAAVTMALAVLNRSGDVGIDGLQGAQKGKNKSAVRGCCQTAEALPRATGQQNYSHACRRLHHDQAPTCLARRLR